MLYNRVNKGPGEQMPRYTISSGNDGFRLALNGKALRTPAGNEYVLPVEALAAVLAEEWNAQDEKKINPATMPMTQFAATSIDIMPRNRETVIARLAAYAGSDLLCHRAENPRELMELQSHKWQPVLDWCEKRFSARLLTGSGVMPLLQRDDALAALRSAITGYDNFHMVGLQSVVDSSGSLILGLALVEKHMDASEVFDAAELDNAYQSSLWGDDHETKKRRENVARDIRFAERWLRLL